MENPPANPAANPEEPSDVVLESKEAIQETGEKVQENVQEQYQNFQPQDKFAYWKTYPGIWKLLQLGFGAIALLCALIALIPECEKDPHKHDRRDREDIACKKHPNGTQGVLAIYSEGYVQAREKQDEKWLEEGYWYKKDNPPNFLNKNYTKIHHNNIMCYCGLLQKDDQGTHIKVPIWIVFALVTWIINVIVVGLQWKDNNFVMQKKFPLMIYYGIIWIVIDLASTCGIYNSIWYKVWYDIEVPMFWATIIGSVCGEINAIFHTLCFHWNYIHKMP